MLFVEICLVCVFGFLVYVTDITDCLNADSSLRNTLSEEQQNVGDLCIDQSKLKCKKQFKYRPINGRCYNLKIPSRGMAGTPCTRLLPAHYKGESEIGTQSDGTEYGSARVFSNVFLTDPDPKNSILRNDPIYNLNSMQWGQFSTHETLLTGAKTGPSCCTTDNKRRKDVLPDSCVAILVPTNDRFYSKFNRTCLNMPRSNTTKDIGCGSNIGAVIPINYNTCYLDGSLIYGSQINTTNLLRFHKDGLLLYQMIDGNMYPPNVKDPTKTCSLNNEEIVCFTAGDLRVNVHPMIGIIQTVLLRLHNLLAAVLVNLNPHWGGLDNKIFYETRRLVIAIIQQITYSEYVPILLGQEYMQKIKCPLVAKSGYNNVYDERINPQIMTEFSTSFKSLHSTITPSVKMYDEKRNVVSEWIFSDFYNNLDFITKGDNFTHLVIGMATQPQSKMDRFFSIAITDLLFQVRKHGLDLESVDIEKGRDQGLNSYVNYLDMIGQEKPKSWEDLLPHMPQNMIDRLQTRYPNVVDVELFIGGILEYPAKQCMFGPVFQAIFGEQFCRMQKGDPYYYELENSPYPFTSDQLDQIRKITLSFVYCYTCKIENIQPDAFRLISDENSLMPCKELLKGVSFDPFKEQQ